MLFFPKVLNLRATNPTAKLLEPVVLLNNEQFPIAILSVPVVLLLSATNPEAKLLLPVVLLQSARYP